MRLVALERASKEELYYVQPDGSYSKSKDGRSKGLTKEQLPKNAEISAVEGKVYWREWVGSRIQDLHTFIVREVGYHPTTGTTTEVIYQGPSKNKEIRRLLVVELKNGIVYKIHVQTETKNKNDPWNPTIRKRLLA